MTRLCLTERLLMGRKESNQTKQKLTDRSVIIGSLVLLAAVIFIILQELLLHLSKQCRPSSDIISFTYVGSALFVKFLYMGAHFIGLLK